MLSQHEADTLAEALTVLGSLRDAAKGEAMSGVKSDEAYYLGRFSGSCAAAERLVLTALSDASAYLDDEKARDVLGDLQLPPHLGQPVRDEALRGHRDP